jgi:hypothetical protein
VIPVVEVKRTCARAVTNVDSIDSSLLVSEQVLETLHAHFILYDLSMV